MTLSKQRLGLAMLAMLSAAVLLVAWQHHSDAGRAHAAVPPQHSATIASWDRLGGDAGLRAAEQAYRACAREASLRSLPVQDFPEVTERVTYLTQDGNRLKRSERTEVDVINMSIDNGCATQAVKSVSVDVLSSAVQAEASPDETGRTVLRRQTQTQQAIELEAPWEAPARPTRPIVRLSISRKPQPATACTIKRDVGVQSHFMMLNLCWHEEKRAETARHEQHTIVPGKAVNLRPSS